VRGISDAGEHARIEPHAEMVGNALTEESGLIVASLGQSARVQWHRDDDRVLKVPSVGLDGSPEQVAERPRQIRPPPILQQSYRAGDRAAVYEPREHIVGWGTGLDLACAIGTERG
jgi:hypothetical protein